MCSCTQKKWQETKKQLQKVALNWRKKKKKYLKKSVERKSQIWTTIILLILPKYYEHIFCALPSSGIYKMVFQMDLLMKQVERTVNRIYKYYFIL